MTSIKREKERRTKKRRTKKERREPNKPRKAREGERSREGGREGEKLTCTSPFSTIKNNEQERIEVLKLN